MTDLSSLNEQQKNAVLSSIDHNIVLLAGAGAGKTSTMIKRTQYLIDDNNISPENIMLVTFTNKAANEIMERMLKVNSNANKIWIGTFHKICTRLIRLHGEKLNIKNFSILDTKDAKNLIRDILKSKGVEFTPFLVNSIISQISTFKNNLRRPSQVLLDEKVNKLYADVYQEYQNICWQRKTFDFDDLIIYTILLLSYDEVKAWVHNKFKYIMVDEAQDTNMAQFMLIKLLIGTNNIMLVGDVNQSIYAFRNAKPEYLENFADSHPNTLKLRLEQNYRSTKTIINAANHVVARNKFGTKLNMFCDNSEGENIKLYSSTNPSSEAKYIASIILSNPEKKLSDYAIIYRANYQSRVIEDEFTKDGIGYTVFGSQSFYTRKEVKDLIAWLKLYVNNKEINSFKRILGTFKGVGKETINKIINHSEEEIIDLHNAIDNKILSANAYSKLNVVKTIMNNKYNTCSDIIFDVLSKTDYKKELIQSGTEEALERIDIINEFQDMLRSMETNNTEDSMIDIIDQIALLSEAKGKDKADLDCVKLMTAHSSKGLEFDTVFIIGAEEGTFPHANSLNENTVEAIEEERRLFYVAMTRAKKNLYITHSAQRTTDYNGNINVCLTSRFINEIPSNLVEETF